MTMRMALHVVGMSALGVAALMGAGLLHEVRMKYPIPTRASAGDEVRGTSGISPSTASNPPRHLRESIPTALAATLDAAAAAFDDNRRTDGVVALDGAYRVADALRAADPGGALAEIFDVVAAARTAVADGRLHRAAAVARAAARIARASTAPVPNGAGTEPGGYVGAAVFTSGGDYVGQLVRADDQTIEVKHGGMRNVLGFIDFADGERRRFPLDQVVFGERRVVGTTIVVVPPESALRR